MRKNVHALITSSVLVTLVLSTTSQAASIEEIKKRAAEINEFKALVNDADPALRLAAIDSMQNSSDLAAKEMAFSAGFNAADESVVALTIRNRFSEIDNFVVKLTAPEGEGKPQEVFAWAGGQVMFNILSYDKDKGTFSNRTHLANSKNQSTISGLNLHLASNYCQGSFRLADDLVYRGNMTCDKAQFPAEIQLF